uniref:Uncharacterized protein n=1 Tax=Cucumis melo TaxID=3656 RepID=A0A9I9EB52_CUCME
MKKLGANFDIHWVFLMKKTRQMMIYEIFINYMTEILSLRLEITVCTLVSLGLLVKSVNSEESCHHVLADDAGRIRTGSKVLPKEIGRPERAEPSDQEKAYEIERLKKLGDTLFEGSTDPADAENWLNMLEKCFDVMNCPEERKSITEEKSAVELSRGTSTTSGFRGHEQRRFTSGINISSRQDFKNRSGGQASRNVSCGSVFQRQSQRIPSQPTRSIVRSQLGQESIASTIRRTPCTSCGRNHQGQCLVGAGRKFKREFRRKKKMNFTRILRLKKRRRTQAKCIHGSILSVPVELGSLFGMVEIEFPVPNNCLSLLKLRYRLPSRQIQVKKSVVRRLHAIFRSKLASSLGGV